MTMQADGINSKKTVGCPTASYRKVWSCDRFDYQRNWVPREIACTVTVFL